MLSTLYELSTLLEYLLSLMDNLLLSALYINLLSLDKMLLSLDKSTLHHVLLSLNVSSLYDMLAAECILHYLLLYFYVS